MKPYETTLYDLNIYLAASPPDPGHPIEETEDWLKLNEPVIGLARAIFCRGGRLVLFGSLEVSRIAAFVAGDYFHVDPRRRPPLVLCDGTEEERGSLYSDFGYQAVLEKGVVFTEFPPSALVVVGGDFRVAEFAQEVAKHFKESPIYIFPSTGGAAANLIEHERELHAINLERETEFLWRPMAERHVGRFFVPPYLFWMQMIRDRIEASSPER